MYIRYVGCGAAVAGAGRCLCVLSFGLVGSGGISEWISMNEKGDS